MALSKVQCDHLKEHLSGLFCQAKFQYGEDTVTVERVRKSENQTCLAVYINGSIKGEWFTEKGRSKAPKILEKVYFGKSLSLYTAATIKRVEKQLGKRQAKKLYPELHKKKISFVPYFSASRTLVNQFKKIEELELIQLGNLPYAEYVANLEAK